MLRGLSVLAALALLVGSGVANGLWNDRWGVSTELEEVAKRLPTVPETIGDWSGTNTDDPKFTQYLIKRGTLHALVSRNYHNYNTNQSVALLMATGRPGPIAAHNPLTCIGNNVSGMEMVTPPTAVSLEIGGKTVAFSHADFRDPKAPATSNGIRVYWSWRNPKEGWIADSSGDPRVKFASYRALTKIYVTQTIPAGAVAANTTGDNADAAIQFLKSALPVIDAALAGK